MILDVLELGNDGTTLQQNYYANKDVDLYAVRAHLMIVGSPAGTITMDIRSTAGKILATSDSHTITDLKTLANAHGMYRFIFDTKLKGSQDYQFVLKSSGYTFSTSAFVGWCAHSDLRRVSLTSGYDDREPLGLEFWSYSEQQKGVA